MPFLISRIFPSNSKEVAAKSGTPHDLGLGQHVRVVGLVLASCPTSNYPACDDAGNKVTKS